MSAPAPVPPPAGGLPQTAPEEARTIVRAFLTEDEERIWFDLTETFDELQHALDQRLTAEHEISLSLFEALMHIAHAEHGAINITELAERIRISPSQVSRIAIDLERRGLVERRRSASDSRSTEVAVTDAGRAQLQTAAPAYLSTIRSYLFDPLPEREIKHLARIWRRIQDARCTTPDQRPLR
jgi:DNA-binding MarR family transcriptional regulator